MKIECRVTSEAELDLDERDLWWTIHRPDSRIDIVDEFYVTVARLGEYPSKGMLDPDVPNVRWVPLSGTPYLIYYRYIDGDSLLEVLSLWSSEQGEKPPQLQ